MIDRSVAITTLRPSEFPWGMAIWFAVGEYRYELVADRPGEYLGTAPIAIQQ